MQSLAAPLVATVVGGLINGGNDTNQSVTDANNASAAAQRDAAALAREQWQYYLDTFKPLEQNLVSKAGDFLDMKFGTPAQQEEAAAAAHGDVTQSFARARDATTRAAASFGLNPASGRFADTTARSYLDEAKADALAQNQARKGIRDEALNKTIATTNTALNIEGIGKGLPASAQTGLNAAASSASSLANSQFLQGQITAANQRAGAAPFISAVQKGVNKWFNSPSGTTGGGNNTNTTGDFPVFDTMQA